MANKNVHLIKDRIFKKNILKINFERKTDRSEITKLNFLTHILFLSSNKYKTERKMLTRAQELYDVGQESFVNIYANATILCFRFTFLKDQYTEPNNSKAVMDFINEILFNPNVKNNKFNKKAFEIAKKEVVDEIKTYFENKNTYSRLKMIEYMDKDSPAAIEVVGTLDEIEKITRENLYEFYLNVINTSLIDIFAFGDFKEKDLSFLSKRGANPKIEYFYKTKEHEVRTYIERDNISQSKLVMGYNLIDVSPKEAEYAMQIYLYLLGLGPTSKLFVNVREKASLCYSISVTTRSINSFMMINAGIAAANFDKTVELISKQVDEMRKGNFKEKDIESAKLTIKSSYQEILENPYSIINSYEAVNYLGYDLIKTRIKKIDLVTKEDIINFANKIKLNTIFLLEGKKK